MIFRVARSPSSRVAARAGARRRRPRGRGRARARDARDGARASAIDARRRAPSAKAHFFSALETFISLHRMRRDSTRRSTRATRVASSRSTRASSARGVVVSTREDEDEGEGARGRLQKFVTTPRRPSQGMEFSFQPAIFQAQLRLHSFGYNPMRKDAPWATAGDGSCGARSRARFRGYGRAATRPRRGREVATRAVARGRGRRRGRARRARGRSTRDDATATRDDATATATRPRGDRPRARGFTRHQGRARVRKVVIFTTGRINWLNLLEWSIKRVVCGKRQQTSTSFLYSGALPATRRARRPVGIARRASRFRGYGREARKNAAGARARAIGRWRTDARGAGRATRSRRETRAGDHRARDARRVDGARDARDARARERRATTGDP